MSYGKKFIWRNKILIEYYHEIPRYGKRKEICPECSEKAISKTEY
jgi:hypothetical protein